MSFIYLQQDRKQHEATKSVRAVEVGVAWQVNKASIWRNQCCLLTISNNDLKCSSTKLLLLLCGCALWLYWTVDCSKEERKPKGERGTCKVNHPKPNQECSRVVLCNLTILFPLVIVLWRTNVQHQESWREVIFNLCTGEKRVFVNNFNNKYKHIKC